VPGAGVLFTVGAAGPLPVVGVVVGGVVVGVVGAPAATSAASAAAFLSLAFLYCAYAAQISRPKARPDTIQIIFFNIVFVFMIVN
jgi:hypothetical protein